MDGQKFYDTQYAARHGAGLEGGIGPSLIGGEGEPAMAKPIKTTGSYWLYAATVFGCIRRNEPLPKSQSLPYNEVYVLTGFCFTRTGYCRKTPMSTSRLGWKKRANRTGYNLDNRADSHDKAC